MIAKLLSPFAPMLTRMLVPKLAKYLLGSAGIGEMTKTFVGGGSSIDIVQSIVKLTPWSWDDKYVHEPLNHILGNAIDAIDGESNEGVKMYRLIIEAMEKEIDVS